MTETHVKDWYCCLNDSERGSIVLCAAQAGPLTYFIIGALFDGYWLAQLIPSNTIRKEIFTMTFGLIEGTIPPEDPDGIKVYYLPPEIWNDINAYLDEHGTGCAAPCKIRTYSD